MIAEVATSGLSRKVKRLIKKLKTAQTGLKNEKDKYARRIIREEVRDIAAELAWKLIECKRYNESYAIATTLPWLTHAEDRYLCEGTALLQLDRVPEARRLLEKGVSRYPDSAPIINAMGNCLITVGNLSGAVEYYERALKIWPRDNDILFNKSGALYHMGQYEETLAITDRLLKRNPNRIDYLKGKGYCLRKIGYPDQAMVYFQKTIQHKNADADAYNGLYWSYYEQGLYNSADCTAQEALRRFPEGYESVYVNLGISYIEKDWFKEARSVVQEGLKRFPEDEELMGLLKEIDDSENDPNQGEETEKPMMLLVLHDKKKGRFIS